MGHGNDRVDPESPKAVIQHRAARLCQLTGRPYLIRPCGGLHPWAMSRGRLKKRLYLALRLRRNLDKAAAIHFTTAAAHVRPAPKATIPKCAPG